MYSFNFTRKVLHRCSSSRAAHTGKQSGCWSRLQVLQGRPGRRERGRPRRQGPLELVWRGEGLEAQKLVHLPADNLQKSWLKTKPKSESLCSIGSWRAKTWAPACRIEFFCTVGSTYFSAYRYISLMNARQEGSMPFIYASADAGTVRMLRKIYLRPAVIFSNS